ncbi:hypothetical protein K1T71_006695 [Dendrolimus kikuchii]|uniref:Uncharacterized protein n=1 Tax=Dendrolimus kikuchii TaxID=765133 RepID=A0ACC1D2R3_9NEOP|nr:hypothetical protein K1T71_006695 [Dendrolimus kikuchii]
MGDFNLSNVNWVDREGFLQPKDLSGDCQIHFFDTLSECNLNQFNLVTNQNNRILDYILCNKSISVSACDDPLVKEDPHHKSLYVEFIFSSYKQLTSTSIMRYLYSAADFDSINTALEDINWIELFKQKSLEASVDLFYSTLHNLKDEFVPRKRIKCSSYPPWFTAPLKKILKEKYKYLKKYRIYGNISDYESFSLLRKRAKIVEKECFKSYITNIEESIIKNPKRLWSYVKSLKFSSNSIPATMSYEGISARTGESICNLFCTYFQSTFLSAPSNGNSSPSIHFLENPYYINSINTIVVEPVSVHELLKSLDINKGAGPDNIAPLLIVKCAKALTMPLTYLFRKSLTEGTVPTIWKSAFITPVHKNGNKSDIKNYRPISKLCIFAKVLERIVYTNVYSALHTGSLLGPLLFTIFINDINNCFKFSNFLLYADDVKIFRSINTINDCYLLQHDLHQFEQYCTLNKLDLNISKCYKITFTRNTCF